MKNELQAPLKITPTKQKLVDGIIAAGLKDNPTLNRAEVLAIMEKTGIKMPYWLTCHGQVARGIYVNPITLAAPTVPPTTIKSTAKDTPEEKKPARQTDQKGQKEADKPAKVVTKAKSAVKTGVKKQAKPVTVKKQPAKKGTKRA